MAKTRKHKEHAYIKSIGSISKALKFFEEKKKSNKFEEYDFSKYENSDANVAYANALSIIKTLDLAMNANATSGQTYVMVIQNILGYNKDYTSSIKANLGTNVLINPTNGIGWSLKINAPVLYALSPEHLQKIYNDKTISLMEEKILNNCLLVKKYSDALNNVLNAEISSFRMAKDITSYIDLINKIAEKTGDLSFINQTDKFDYYIIPSSYNGRLAHSSAFKKEYEAFVKTKSFDSPATFELLGKTFYGENDLKVTSINDPAYSFLIGRLHPYFLLYAISHLAEEFVDQLAPYKYEPGDVVYLRSSISEYAINLLSASTNYYENRTTISKIRASTIKNSCGGIIVNYASKDKCRTRLKSYVVNLFTPAKTITVPEKDLNFLQRKRRVKDSDDDLMDTPL